MTSKEYTIVVNIDNISDKDLSTTVNCLWEIHKRFTEVIVTGQDTASCKVLGLRRGVDNLLSLLIPEQSRRYQVMLDKVVKKKEVLE